MSLAQLFGPGLSLAELQDLIDKFEPGDGPVDEISIDTQNSAQVTSIVFDTAVIIDKPVSKLVLDSGAPPPDLYPYVRGQCFVGGRVENVVAYVTRDQDVLAMRCVSFLLAYGWTREQAIGIAANIKGESSFDPTSDIGDQHTAYGLCQWRLSRRTNFQAAMGRRIEGSTFREQLAFILWELGHDPTFRAAAGQLKAASTIEDAVRVFCTSYEIPKHPDQDTLKRIQYAKRIANLV